jgi:hypothetical protein
MRHFLGKPLRMGLLAAIVVLATIACGAIKPVPAATPLSLDQLKFRLLDSVGKPVYCDRDYYPVGRPGGEQASAIAEYPKIRADATLYSAIVGHEHLPAGELTDDQKLTLYRAWKLLQALELKQNGDTYSFSYKVQKQMGTASYTEIIGTIKVDGTITITSQTPTGPPNCPICLAAKTLIATPDGEIAVTDIRPGMLVWTVGFGGTHIAAPVADTGSTPVPAGHQMVHLVLADGRALEASPGHRTGDGRPLGTLAVGDRLDGSTITTWELIPYAGDRTYDLLPSGPTGEYWADGILLSSTLEHQ